MVLMLALLHVGSIHYNRIHPAYWRDRLMRVRSMGLNAIQARSGVAFCAVSTDCTAPWAQAERNVNATATHAFRRRLKA